jgi:hypothetical protein
MNKFDYSNIKSLNLNFNQYCWNSNTHNITVSYDRKSPSKFKIKMIPIYHEPEILTVDDANKLLEKFKLKK